MNKITKLCLSACVVLILKSPLAFGSMDDDRRPDEHKCPITIDVMTDPVVAADGHSYERAAIEHHFRVNGAKSPSTGLPLENMNLFDNHALKVMINEWKVGNQSAPSELETKYAGDIAQRVKEEFRKKADLLTPEKGAQGQHIVAFLGNTGAGKSTLVNLLAGKTLSISPDEEDYILADKADTTAMVIGHGGSSETLYPKSIDVGGLRFFDLPGFNDTDGSERNLVNAAFIRKILLDAESVRFVYVVGQDQFTADRSASVKHLFNSLKQLFVVDQGVDFTDNGIFVATKMTCAPQTDIIEFLLRRTNANDKAELNQQLKSWHQSQKIFRMFHPLRDQHNQGIRDEILSNILNTKPTKVRGINVSALYPPDTKSSLERMFLNVMEQTLNRKLTTPLTTLTDYDRALSHYRDARFWETFNADLCRQEHAIGLLKDFCINPYNKALRSLERDNEGNRHAHIERLREKRDWRVDQIRKETESKARNVISSIASLGDNTPAYGGDSLRILHSETGSVSSFEDKPGMAVSSLIPKKNGDDFVFFDFAYHRDYYDKVCGADSINEITLDLTEQEIVRRHYADFMSRHSHDQMMRWHQKFSGMDELTRRLNSMEAELKRLTAPEGDRMEVIERPIRIIPEVALGYEAIYERFLRGVLVYRPQEGSDEGRIEMRIADLANPLGSTFDLSRCGDTGTYLSIATGYRRVHTPSNRGKVEIWFTPKFLVDKEMARLAPSHHMRTILGSWDAARAPVGIFWTWGGWNASDQMVYCDYLTTEASDVLGTENLLKKYQKRGYRRDHGPRIAGQRWICFGGLAPQNFTFRL